MEPRYVVDVVDTDEDAFIGIWDVKVGAFIDEDFPTIRDATKRADQLNYADTGSIPKAIADMFDPTITTDLEG